MLVGSVALVVALLVSCDAVKLPSYLPQCKRDESLNECLKNSANAGLPTFTKGDPSVHVINMTPLKVNEMFIDVDGGLKVNLTNFIITGLGAGRVENFDWDFENNKIALDMRAPVAALEGTYDISGRILILPITGNGPCNITFVNGLYKLRYTYEIQERNGKEYYNIVKGGMTYDADRVYFGLENLFGGNERLATEMSKFLDENWKEVNGEIGKQVGNGLAEIFTSIIKSFLNRVPIKDLWES